MMMSGLAAFALLACVSNSASAVSLRGAILADATGGHPLRMIDIGDDALAGAARSQLTSANTMIAVLTDVVSGQDISVNYCFVDDLLAEFDNIDVEALTSLEVPVAAGDFVNIRCKPGFLPPAGKPDTAGIMCDRYVRGKARFDMESGFSCGRPCLNSELSTVSGTPSLHPTGTTIPLGLVEMICALKGLLPVYAECTPEGTWATTQPCMPCDTSALALREPSVQLSAHGMLLPQSIVQMRCPKDMYAHPSAMVTARCLPGGQWGFSALSCRIHGCDTATLLPKGLEGSAADGVLGALGASVLELDQDMEGRLAVGAQIKIRQVQALSSGLTTISFTGTCLADGTWSKTHSHEDLLQA